MKKTSKAMAGKGIDRGSDEDEAFKRMSRRMAASDFMPDDDDDDDHNGDSEMEQEDDENAQDASEGEDGEDMAGTDFDEDGSIDEDEEVQENDDSDQELHKSRKGEIKKLENELASYSFGDLLKVQETMGLKKFKKMRGTTLSKRDDHGDDDQEDDEYDDSEDGDDQTKQSQRAVSKSKEPKEIKKRRNQHAPQEISSKKPVSRRRVVVPTAPVTKRVRDPRFSELSGDFNPGLFKNSYKFLEDYRKSEIEDIQKRLMKAKGANERARLQAELRSMESKKKTEEDLEKKKNVVREWRKAEAEAVKEGKKPYFLKKTDVKKLVLVDKFKSMTPAQVEKAVERRRKDNAQREKRFMPYQRRSK